MLALSVRCIRSWRGFCSGWPGQMRYSLMPSLSHQIAKRVSPPSATEANGAPLSLQIASGKPY